MADVKLIVIYPSPQNVGAFEKIYQNEHVPLAVAKLGGAAIQENVPVFEGEFRITQDVTVTPSKPADAVRSLVSAPRTISIAGELKYQACDKTVCYPPTSVPVSWQLQILPLDLKRSPGAIQHK